ncbi:hypothetical protein [uncultured Algoriphagus sp.]|uniref:hypothetical protein n=1 Tax=uncultured Algoriphagus sp. TaxID=417365 RepID=UPI00258A98A7|nr:hypothetical protein [uncultured Algoriphagus sp.]
MPKPLHELSDRELAETQVRLLSAIRKNSSNILMILGIFLAVTILGGIILATS